MKGPNLLLGAALFNPGAGAAFFLLAVFMVAAVLLAKAASYAGMGFVIFFAPVAILIRSKSYIAGALMLLASLGILNGLFRLLFRKGKRLSGLRRLLGSLLLALAIIVPTTLAFGTWKAAEFAHNKLREGVYEYISPANRAPLVQAAAELELDSTQDLPSLFTALRHTVLDKSPAVRELLFYRACIFTLDDAELDSFDKFLLGSFDCTNPASIKAAFGVDVKALLANQRKTWLQVYAAHQNGAFDLSRCNRGTSHREQVCGYDKSGFWFMLDAKTLTLAPEPRYFVNSKNGIAWRNEKAQPADVYLFGYDKFLDPAPSAAELTGDDARFTERTCFRDTLCQRLTYGGLKLESLK